MCNKHIQAGFDETWINAGLKDGYRYAGRICNYVIKNKLCNNVYSFSDSAHLLEKDRDMNLDEISLLTRDKHDYSNYIYSYIYIYIFIYIYMYIDVWSTAADPYCHGAILFYSELP